MLDQLIPIAGVVLALWVAWTLIQKLMRRDALQPRGGSHLHLKAYCTHCNWEGRVDPAHRAHTPARLIDRRFVHLRLQHPGRRAGVFAFVLPNAHAKTRAVDLVTVLKRCSGSLI